MLLVNKKLVMEVFELIQLSFREKFSSIGEGLPNEPTKNFKWIKKRRTDTFPIERF